jgi:hypothetical protein
MERTQEDEALYVRGLELRIQSLELTVEQLGEVAESVRPKLCSSVQALEAFERLQEMVESGTNQWVLMHQHEDAVRCMREALAAIRSGE